MNLPSGNEKQYPENLGKSTVLGVYLCLLITEVQKGQYIRSCWWYHRQPIAIPILFE